MKIELTQDQENAKNLIYEWYFNTDNQFFVLSGYAGTGKTFLIDYVVRNVLHLEIGKEAVFVSPTGKAAANLLKNGTLAGTVHSLIYIREIEVDENGEVIEQDEIRFVKRNEIDANIRLIIIDEASMVNEEVLRDLLSFNVKCLFCGDGAQLPPVSGYCPLLARPNYTMTNIVRQAADNPIIQVATLARIGEYISYWKFGDKVGVVSKSAVRGEVRRQLLMAADQVICGTNRTRNALNQEIRRYNNIPDDARLPIAGEKLICTLNDWEKPLDKEEKFHLVNGIIGYADDVQECLDGLATMNFRADFMQESVKVPFDVGVFNDGRYYHGYGNRAVTLANGMVVSEFNAQMLRRFKSVADEPVCRFEFGYAITCHKAQGSEFDCVVVFDESWAFGEEWHRWLYTAITRAKKKLLIIR